MDLFLVDFDDTLVDTAPRFHAARNGLFALLEDRGFPVPLVEEVHHEDVDPRWLDRMGYGPGRLPHSFAETYELLCLRTGRTPDPGLSARCRQLGLEVAGPPPVFPGSLEALERLARVHPVAIFSQSSEPEYQLRCIRASGAAERVGEDRIRITERKTPESFLEAMGHFGARDPGRVCMIGNSIRSDVNPARIAGAWAIQVDHPAPWHHDLVDPVDPLVPVVSTFADAVERVLASPFPFRRS